MKKAILKLKDGKEFCGVPFGAEINLDCAEVVFNTGIPGYEEILTDPSYKGQIVNLTSPMIGNYGITKKDGESDSVKVTALIVKKLYKGKVMNGRLTLDEYLKKEGIPAIEGIDTRALTIHLRENGSQNGILFYEDDRKEAEEKGLYNTIGEEIDNKYIEELKKLIVNQEAINKMQKDIKIVYSPLHGTGLKLVQRILKEVGFENVYIVKEQEKPDGHFPTVSYPNPEDPKAFVLALKLAKEVDADIILANDPDADRLGIYVKDKKTGEYIQFNGNMTGNLVCEYILSQKKANGTLPKNGAVIKTIVSSNMTDAIAKEYGVKLFSTLTGFKNIAKIIRGFEEDNSYKCLFSYEESYGCIIGTHARDKDGIVAVMTICEAVTYYKMQGLTLWDAMNNMYKKYGYYKEKQMSITLKGIEGAEEIKKMMENMRNNPAKEIAGLKVISFGDYQKQEITDSNGNVSSTGLSKSNVLYFDLEKNAWVCVRPSGTEPKIKFYMGVCEESSENAERKLNELENAIKDIAEEAKK